MNLIEELEAIKNYTKMTKEDLITNLIEIITIEEISIDIINNYNGTFHSHDDKVISYKEIRNVVSEFLENNKA